MTPQDLTALGIYLYGSRWQTPLARALPVHDRIIRYWLAGSRTPSEARIAQVAALARARHRQRLDREESGYVAIARSMSSAALCGLLLG